MTGRPEAAPAAQSPTTTESRESRLRKARAHFESGRLCFAAGEYADAVAEFRAADAYVPSPILDFDLALAYERLDKKRVALRYLRRYLEGQPSATNRADVEQRIERLERELQDVSPTVVD